MFKVEEVNCICVDWKKGSRTTYTQAANNVRVVGAQVAQLLSMLSVSPPAGLLPRQAAPTGLCWLKMQLGVRYLKKEIERIGICLRILLLTLKFALIMTRQWKKSP